MAELRNPHFSLQNHNDTSIRVKYQANYKTTFFIDIVQILHVSFPRKQYVYKFLIQLHMIIPFIALNDQ